MDSIAFQPFDVTPTYFFLFKPPINFDLAVLGGTNPFCFFPDEREKEATRGSTRNRQSKNRKAK